MGRDLTLYPKKASKNNLKEFIENLGFEKCGHFWSWPKGTLNYSWFNYDDFKSTTGISADIYPVSKDELEITGNTWALHVRNLYHASWHDVKMLNDVLRKARKLFGGKIYGDYGINRYAPIWHDDSTPISRGVSAVYQHVRQKLGDVRIALPQPYIKQHLENNKENHDFIEYHNSLDPSRVIYNGLVPFAVSMFEYFFSKIFEILITYDTFAIEKRNTYKLKVNFSTLIKVGNKEKTIENVITEEYTFQNLQQLNKAYKDWLNIDVRKILYKKKKIGNSITFLENRIFEIIQYRHGIIHRFEIDTSLTREDYINILEAIDKTMSEFVSFIERKYNIKISSLY